MRIERLPDGTDASIHHVAGRHAVGACPGIREGGGGKLPHAGCVVEMIGRIIQHAAMPVGRRRAQAYVHRDPDPVAEALFHRGDLRGRERPVDVMGLVCGRHTEQQELAHSGSEVRLDLLQQRGRRVAEHPGEARDGLATGNALHDEQWLDELLGMGAGAAGQGADVFVLPQAAETDLAHGFRCGPRGRKASKGPSILPQITGLMRREVP
jgi:hypothetical protein